MIEVSFEQELDEILLKFDIKTFREFVREHSLEYGKKFVEIFLQSGDEFTEIVMHKLIAMSETLPEKVISKSVKWLKKRKFWGQEDD